MEKLLPLQTVQIGHNPKIIFIITANTTYFCRWCFYVWLDYRWGLSLAEDTKSLILALSAFISHKASRYIPPPNIMEIGNTILLSKKREITLLESNAVDAHNMPAYSGEMNILQRLSLTFVSLQNAKRDRISITK